MDRRDRRGVPRPALLGGSLIAVGARAGLVPVLSPLDGAGLLGIASEVLLLLGAVALTLPGGSVVDGSPVGTVALVLLGGIGLLGELVLSAVQDAGLVLGETLLWIAPIVGVVAVVAVRRAGVLTGFARWVLVLPTAAYLLIAVVETVPLGDPTVLLGIGVVLPLGFLVTGIALIGFELWRGAPGRGVGAVRSEPTTVAGDR